MFTFGIDIGSTSSKVAILKDGTELVAHYVVPHRPQGGPGICL